MSYSRTILIVLDSLGIGELPDAAVYGDTGTDTLGHLAEHRKLYLPTLCALGLANIRPLSRLIPEPNPVGCYGRCALASPGKDTTTGHWEMAGIHLAKPLPLYPEGFPPEIIGEFERLTGRQSLGNVPASGTEIIAQLGEEHMRSGSPIVYTSADSVFQVAAHEDVIPIEEQYRICETARKLLSGPHEVGRVIARPFVGAPGAFTRTTNRRDFAVAPPEGMLLDRLSAANVTVTTVGKVAEVFLGRGVTTAIKTTSNDDGMAKTLDAVAQYREGLIWINLVDFDMLYGHRNDVEGYAKALEQVDAWLPQLLEKLVPGDLLILTADHGCDPTTPSTDHTREYVPLLMVGSTGAASVDLGIRSSLSDIGQTIAQNFGTELGRGKSLLSAIT
jgi:phosphopentomutase